MKNLWLLLILLIACGTAPRPEDATPDTPAIERLRLATESARSWAPTCSKVEGLVYPSYDPNGDAIDCGDGDGVYLNGMLCLVGETAACDMVHASIDEDGRLWRSPYRKLNGDSGVNTASRDQMNGFLMYLIATKDTILALRFQNYLNDHGNKLCPYDTDGRCNLTSISYGLLSKVWDYIGVSRPVSWVAHGSILTNTLKLEASTVSPGYQMFLIGQQILILIRTGDYSLVAEGAANTLFEREQGNPFYRYLAKGADLEAIQLAIDQTPTTKPIPAIQFAVSRRVSEQAWKNSSGWDYIFLYKLFIGAGK